VLRGAGDDGEFARWEITQRETCRFGVQEQVWVMPLPRFLRAVDLELVNVDEDPVMLVAASYGVQG